jgi:hypothetical protein
MRGRLIVPHTASQCSGALMQTLTIVKQISRPDCSASMRACRITAAKVPDAIRRHIIEVFYRNTITGRQESDWTWAIASKGYGPLSNFKIEDFPVRYENLHPNLYDCGQAITSLEKGRCCLPPLRMPCPSGKAERTLQGPCPRLLYC